MQHSIDNIVAVKSITLSDINGQKVIKVKVGKNLSIKERIMNLEGDSDLELTIWPLKNVNYEGKTLTAEEITKSVNNFKLKMAELLTPYIGKEKMVELIMNVTESVFGSLDNANFDAEYNSKVVKQSTLDKLFELFGSEASKALNAAPKKDVRMKLVSRKGNLNIPSYGKFVEDLSIPIENTQLKMTKKEDEESIAASIPVDPEVIAKQTKDIDNIFS